MARATEAVLVTTDLSPLGDAALPMALTLARGRGARLILLSVVETPPAPSPLYAHYYPMPKPAQIETSRAELEGELKTRLAAHPSPGVDVEIVTCAGDPAAEIARVAKEKGVALIVISTHGRSGIKHYILGSVAEKVLRTTTCPVLLVR